MDHQFIGIDWGLQRDSLISPGVILFFSPRTLFATGAKKYIDFATPLFPGKKIISLNKNFLYWKKVLFKNGIMLLRAG